MGAHHINTHQSQGSLDDEVPVCPSHTLLLKEKDGGVRWVGGWQAGQHERDQRTHLQMALQEGDVLDLDGGPRKGQHGSLGARHVAAEGKGPALAPPNEL